MAIGITIGYNSIHWATLAKQQKALEETISILREVGDEERATNLDGIVRVVEHLRNQASMIENGAMISDEPIVIPTLKRRRTLSETKASEEGEE